MLLRIYTVLTAYFNPILTSPFEVVAVLCDMDLSFCATIATLSGTTMRSSATPLMTNDALQARWYYLVLRLRDIKLVSRKRFTLSTHRLLCPSTVLSQVRYAATSLLHGK